MSAPLGLITAILLISSSAFALVDMRNANYSDSWIDLQVKGSAYDLRVQRSYNSRTLFNGIFGFGWCSEFETTMKVTAESSLKVTECGAGFEIEYRPGTYTGKSVDDNVKAILAEVRKRNPKRDESYFKNLERDVRRDSELRDEFARQLKVNSKVTEGTRYVASGRATDYIIMKGGEYTRYLPNGTLQKFNKTGQIVQMNDRNGNFIKIAYKGDKITTVTDNTGNSLQLKYHDGTKFVKQVVGPKGLTASYKYKGENLVEITNAWKNVYKHEYDDLYNMTKAAFPDGTAVTISYDKDKDWVTSFRDRRGCTETYAYKDSEKDPANNYSSTVEKVCGGKVTNKSTYEFWHKTNKDNTRYLSRTKSVINGRTVDTTYHEEFGRPIEMIQDGIITRYEYYPNGLLKKKADVGRVYAYKYDNPCNKVSSVSVTSTYQVPVEGKDRKPTTKSESQTLTTNFNYDIQKCNLIAAKSSTGQAVALNYDMRGRIAKIVDQSKKEVRITYEDRFGKPDVVTRPGLGTIKFKYKDDGSMDKFDSSDDPLVAVQVANIFSNLLEIIAPATTESNNI